MTNIRSALDTQPLMDLLVQRVDGLTGDEKNMVDLLSFGIQYGQIQNKGLRDNVNP